MDDTDALDLHRESGQTMAEYAIVLAVISLGVLTALYLVQASVTSRLLADINTLVVGLSN